MYLLHRIVMACAWLIACAWLYKLLETARGLAGVPNLLQLEFDGQPAGNPSITVIVPARNEAANVAACLDSLVGQDYANVRVLAVNDRSTDATGARMGECAERSGGRLEVLTITELPANWLGKTHAMATAARAAMASHSPDYLLFTDADILFRRDAIRRTLVGATAAEADHFILMPTAVNKTLGEGMLLAYLQVMSFWAVRLWRVADAKAKRDALGVGAFNLLLTSAYRELGGFEAAPMEILEDLELGRRVKRAGLRQRVAWGPGMVRVHWASGAHGIVAGMTKNLFAVFDFRPAYLLVAAVTLAILGMGPACMMAVPGLRLAGVIAWGAAAGLYGLSARTSRISAWYSLTLPVAAAMVVYSMLRSMAVTIIRGGVSWRGTFYSLVDLRAHTRGRFWRSKF
jgi:glycosyltransferase involved in cell wall biosynthesis